jgi:hypothetical protein
LVVALATATHFHPGPRKPPNLKLIQPPETLKYPLDNSIGRRDTRIVKCILHYLRRKAGSPRNPP